MRPTALTGLVLACLAPLAALAESPEAARFWSTDSLHIIKLRITPQQWRMLQPQQNQRNGQMDKIDASDVTPPMRQHMPSIDKPPARPYTQPATRPGAAPAVKPEYREGTRLEPNFYGYEFAYVKAAFECDGVKLADVGLRLRGNSSYNYAARGYHRPMKLDFNRFVKAQDLHGIGTVLLNNNAYDPSRLREALGYEVFRKLGVPAPRTAFANVYLTIDGVIDQQYLGVYTLIEEIDSSDFLKHHFKSADGLLLKPWSIRGLPYFGEDWAEYIERYNPESDLPPEQLDAATRRAIDLVKLINYATDEHFARDIDAYLNADGFLRMLAGLVLQSSLDSCLWTGHNQYLYLSPTDGLFHYMPVDLNLSFAVYTTPAPAEELANLDIFRPHVGEMKLIDRLLAIPRYNQAYREHLRRAVSDGGVFHIKTLGPRIAELNKVLAAAETEADKAWAAKYEKAGQSAPPRPRMTIPGWRGGPAIELEDFIQRRTASVEAQLAGKEEGSTFSPQGGRRRGRVR